MRHDAVSFARERGVSDPALAAIQLSIPEAVSNAIVHAFRNAEGLGSVNVSILVKAGETVDVIVVDDGGGMVPRDDSPGLGLGLALIQRLADDVEIRLPQSGIGTEIWMRFRLTSA